MTDKFKPITSPLAHARRVKKENVTAYFFVSNIIKKKE